MGINRISEVQSLIRNISIILPEKELKKMDQVSYFLLVTEGKSLNSEFIMRTSEGIKEILLYVDYYRKNFLRSIQIVCNETGDITSIKNLSDVPEENMWEEILKFLKRLQPENLDKLGKVTHKKPHFDVVSEAKFKDFTIQKSVQSSYNNKNPSGRVFNSLA